MYILTTDDFHISYLRRLTCLAESILAYDETVADVILKACKHNIDCDTSALLYVTEK